MVDPDRVHTKLGALEEALRGLREKQDCSLEAFRDDRDRQDVVERRFEKAIQASIDIAGHIVSAEGFGEPNTYGDLFEILVEEGVLPRETAEEMIEIAGFRNVFVHEYGDIQADRVYAHLQDLSRFDDFAADVLQVLDSQE